MVTFACPSLHLRLAECSTALLLVPEIGIVAACELLNLKMQSMQRQFGKLMNKGPGDNAKIAAVLHDYEDADKLLVKVPSSYSPLNLKRSSHVYVIILTHGSRVARLSRIPRLFVKHGSPWPLASGLW